MAVRRPIAVRDLGSQARHLHRRAVQEHPDQDTRRPLLRAAAEVRVYLRQARGDPLDEDHRQRAHAGDQPAAARAQTAAAVHPPDARVGARPTARAARQRDPEFHPARPLPRGQRVQGIQGRQLGRLAGCRICAGAGRWRVHDPRRETARLDHRRRPRGARGAAPILQQEICQRDPLRRRVVLQRDLRTRQGADELRPPVRSRAAATGRPRTLRAGRIRPACASRALAGRGGGPLRHGRQRHALGHPRLQPRDLPDGGAGSGQYYLPTDQRPRGARAARGHAGRRHGRIRALAVDQPGARARPLPERMEPRDGRLRDPGRRGGRGHRQVRCRRRREPVR